MEYFEYSWIDPTTEKHICINYNLCMNTESQSFLKTNSEDINAEINKIPHKNK